MATAAPAAPSRPGWFDRIVTDRVLGVAAIVMAAVVALAVARGRADWGGVPPVVWLHLGLIGTALGLTPVQLLRRQGTPSHRVVGYLWTAAMVLTAATSLTFKTGVTGRTNWGVFSGDISPIHLISLFVLIMVPRLVLAARRHDIVAHRRGVRGVVIGALLVAGFFTFPFDRLLGHWLFS